MSNTRTLPIRWERELEFRQPVGGTAAADRKSKIEDGKTAGANGSALAADRMQRLQDEIAGWQGRTFPGQTLDGKLAHLVEEAGELRGDPDDLMEWADVLILVLGAAAQRGFSVDDLVSLARIKFEIAKQRKNWVEQADGSFHHVEEAK